MRKTPDCPRCGEDGLVLYRAGETFRLVCVECSWRVSGELVTGQDLDEQIAATVAKAKEAEAGVAFYRELSRRKSEPDDAPEGATHE